MVKVLFVCLGNICRSPLAEGIFKNMIKKRGLSSEIEVDSAGTADYHIGKAPDHRSCSVAEKYEIILEHKARQFLHDDFKDFDYIIAMDRTNYLFVRKMRAKEGISGKLLLMREFEPHRLDDVNVPDPYYGGMDGFEEVYQILVRCCERLLDYIVEEKQLK